MKPRFRSPSLFWTFAGSFLAVLIAVAVLQALVMVLVLRPFTAHWKKAQAELLTRQVAGELAESPASLSDDDIRAVLRSHQTEDGSETLAFVWADGRIVAERRFPPPIARWIEQVISGDPELPVEKPGERPWRPGEPGLHGRRGGDPERGGKPPELLSRRAVELASGETGEILVLGRPQRFSFWPHDVPGPLLLSLPIAVLRVEESDRGRRQLLADISHELATPLTSIRGYAETLLDPSVPVSDEERSGYLQNVLEESKRMDFLIGDLLDLTRLEAGAVSLSMDRIDLTGLSRNVMNRFENWFRQAGLSVKWWGPVEEAWVSADGRRIEQVIENLLVNALRYVPSGGEVTLSVERAAGARSAGGAGGARNGVDDGATRVKDVDRYCLTVSDDGPGFPAEDLPHVFDRFYRADAARSTGGSGLGLAIVKEIIRLHSGEVRAENRQPSGASIHVELPSTV
jgi:signal transduction histidine kinase